MTTAGAPSPVTVRQFEDDLERARRLAALRLQTLAGAVRGSGDDIGFARLTTLGTKAIVDAQGAAIGATEDMLIGTLIDNQVPGDDVVVSIEVGQLQSGAKVDEHLAKSQDVVRNRIAGGDTFEQAMQSTALHLIGLGASEPHRIGRQGLAEFGAADGRFDRWRRIAEAGACAWCRMLATRGAVYHSESTARVSGHAHCRCSIEELVDPAVIEWSKASGALRWRAELAAGTQWQPSAAKLARDRRRNVEQQLRNLRRRRSRTAWAAARIASLETELAGMAA